MREVFAAHRDPEFVTHGEVRQRQTARWIGLREEHLLLVSVLGAPHADPPLQGAQHPIAEHLTVTALQLLEQRAALQPRFALEQGHQLLLPDVRQRIGARPPCPWSALRRQPVGLLDASRRAHADAHPGRRDLLRRLPSCFLVFAHLLVRDLLAGHRAPPNACRQKSTLSLASGPSRLQIQPAKIVVVDRSG